MFLKRFAPKSLYGRFLLIIIVPAVLVQAIATFMFYERHWDSITRNVSASIASEIALTLDKVREAKSESTRRKAIQDAQRYLNLDVNIHSSKVPQAVAGKPSNEFEEFENAIKDYFDKPFYLVDKAEEATIEVVFNDAKETIIVSFPRKRLINPSTYIYIMWIVGAGGILLIVSILFLKNQLRSIVRLTDAAQKFGKGQESIDFKPQGAEEIRQAAIAFIDMKDRIKRQIRQRTEMLAGVSHDLRTPLTRMKLQLTMMKDSEPAQALQADVAEMEHMVEGYLEFVRGGESEKTESVNLAEFIKKMINTHPEAAGRTHLHLRDEVTLNIRKHALKRALNNLINNALNYAENIEITVRLAHDHAQLIIEDDGPGIPKESRENVFTPFVRLDASRNSATGGTGLGLTIARDIIHRHGGHITLGHSSLGGLEVVVDLPL